MFLFFFIFLFCTYVTFSLFIFSIGNRNSIHTFDTSNFDGNGNSEAALVVLGASYTNDAFFDYGNYDGCCGENATVRIHFLSGFTTDDLLIDFQGNPSKFGVPYVRAYVGAKLMRGSVTTNEGEVALVIDGAVFNDLVVRAVQPVTVDAREIGNAAHVLLGCNAIGRSLSAHADDGGATHVAVDDGSTLVALDVDSLLRASTCDLRGELPVSLLCDYGECTSCPVFTEAPTSGTNDVVEDVFLARRSAAASKSRRSTAQLEQELADATQDLKQAQEALDAALKASSSASSTHAEL